LKILSILILISSKFTYTVVSRYS